MKTMILVFALAQCPCDPCLCGIASPSDNPIRLVGLFGRSRSNCANGQCAVPASGPDVRNLKPAPKPDDVVAKSRTTRTEVRTETETVASHSRKERRGWFRGGERRGLFRGWFRGRRGNCGAGGCG